MIALSHLRPAAARLRTIFTLLLLLSFAALWSSSAALAEDRKLKDEDETYTWKGHVQFEGQTDPQAASFHSRVQASIKRGVKNLLPSANS